MMGFFFFTAYDDGHDHDHNGYDDHYGNNDHNGYDDYYGNNDQNSNDDHNGNNDRIPRNSGAGLAYRNMNDVKKALKSYVDALKLQVKEYGNTHADVAATQTQIAEIQAGTAVTDIQSDDDCDCHHMNNA